MQFWHIQYFLGIVKYGTMTAAAQELHISQSSLSSAIKSLEEELGVRLFDRVGRKLVLNEHGKYFLQKAESIDALMQQTVDNVRSHVKAETATVNCALGSPIGNPGALVAGFTKQHPEYALRIGFTFSGSFNVFPKEDIDVTITATPLHLEEEDTVYLGTEAYAMALPMDHPFKDNNPFKLSDFKDEPFVESTGGQSLSCFSPKALCQEAGFTPHVVSEVQWHTDALQLVEAGVGCCIVPEYTWLAHQTYNIAVRHFDDVKHHRHIYVQYSQHKQPTPATKAFVEFLQGYSKDLVKQPF